MVLSDRSIRDELRHGRLVIRPLADCNIQPASVDVRLGSSLVLFRETGRSHIDVREEANEMTVQQEIGASAPYLLAPGAFVLASTMEYIEIPTDVVARLEGKSSLTRLGLFVNTSSGYVDPGWKGNLTFGITNGARLPVTLYRGMPIGQLSFLRLTTEAQNAYGSPPLGSKYQGRTDPAASLMSRNFPSHGGTAKPD